MAEITDVVEVPISEILDDLTSVKYCPVLTQRAVMSRIKQITKGVATFVDPSNPFILLLEASCVNTSAAVLENRSLLRKQYPSLATDETDLYRHMSDMHYKNRFASPASTYVYMMVNLTELKNQMIEDTDEGCYKATVPRDTKITANGYTFTMQYPIDFKLFYNNVLQVTYDNTYSSPLQTLKTNVIDYVKRKDADSVEWLMITIPIWQFAISSNHFAAQASSFFSEDIEYSDYYYYSRVFYKNSTGEWTDMVITHSDQVYDPYKPTALITVNTGKINVSIPPVYINSGLISGEIRVDVYTTKGEISVNTANYAVSEFSATLQALDEDRDINDYTNVFTGVTFFFYTDAFITGGKAAMSFDDLRTAVIEDSIGTQVIPITNVELASESSKLGFDLIKNVDTITNRIYLATRALPAPTDTSLITAANITIDSLIATMEDLAAYPEILDNGSRLTIPPDVLYSYDNGQLSIHPKASVTALKSKSPAAIAETVNNNNFLYSPFHYVLDGSSDEFEMRAYYLTAPRADDLSFVSQNTTADLQVNTNSFEVEKITDGYRLTLSVKSDDYYKALDDSKVGVILGFKPTGEGSYGYLVGEQIAENDGERIFQFTLGSNFDVNSDDDICLTNFSIYSTDVSKLYTPLSTEFMILYTTSSVPEDFVADAANALVPRFLVDSEFIAITRETITVDFGKALKTLWSGSRTMAAGLNYQTYTEDVPAYYEDDIYRLDPEVGSCFNIVDGELVYDILHKKGDPILDAEGNTVYKYRTGDVVLDDNGDPIKITGVHATRYFDLLLVDGSYYFSTDDVYISYRDEVAETIATWVTETLEDLDDILLDNTKIYYYPKKAIGSVAVKLSNDTVVNIDSAQSFNVVLYVPTTIYQNDRMRSSLEKKTAQVLNTYIQKQMVNMTDITAALRDVYGSSVNAFKIDGLGGESNYPTITVNDNSNRLSLAKVLKEQDDGTLVVSEDITFEYVDYTKTTSVS